MLAEPTIAKLEALGLGAMAAGLAEQLGSPGGYDELCFADRLGLLVDREADARDTRRLASRLKAAKLRYPAGVEACRDLLEVVEDRSQLRSTVVVSQLPVERWLAAMADPTLAEAVLDRVLQASHRVTMKGPSMRRRQPPDEGDGGG